MNIRERKNILIVEDDFVTAKLGKIALEKYGYNVITSDTGENALETINGEPDIDLILMDINLGDGIDGTETARLILKNRDIPLVFLSSHIEPEVVNKTEEITSYGYVVKNSGITVLDASIKMAFKLFEANKNLKNELNKMLEKHLDLMTEILGILNNEQSFHNSIEHILFAIKRKTSFDAVGIRLKDCDDYPYYAQTGFSNDFLLTENSLIARDSAGGICRDKNDNLCLECTCGLVLSGLTNPANPLFTKNGSYWTNNSLPLSEFPDGKDPRLHPRNKCIRQGYLSVALIPIRVKQTIVGLLQLNDRQKDRFTLEMIYFFEGISASIGMALMRKQSAEKLQASETRYRRLFETAKDGILILDAQTGRIVDVNPFLTSLLGYSYEQFLDKAIWDIGFFKNIIATKEKFTQLQEKKYVRYEGLPLQTASGKIIEVEFISNVYEIDREKIIQCSIRDITERIIDEEKIKALFEKKQLMLKEAHHRIKNNMNAVAGIISRQLKSLNEPSAVKALKEAESSVMHMVALYDKLGRSENLEAISIKQYFTPLLDELISNFPNNEIVKTEINIDDFLIDSKRLSRLGIIINEFIANIMKHAFDGRDSALIMLSAMVVDNRATIVIEDDGIGAAEPDDVSTAEELELRLIDIMRRQLRGTLKIERDKVIKFILEFNL